MLKEVIKVRKTKGLLIYTILLLTLVILGGCGGSVPEDRSQVENPLIRLATTTSTEDSGLLDVLLPAFEEETGYQVDVLSMGTGKAIATGELGDCDVILVHARVAEEEFVEKGFGVNRKDVMYNDYVILGPLDDPAKIRGLSIEKALIKLMEEEVTFVSRGDNSGTHMKERSLWEEYDLAPQGNWYLEVNKGMGDTLIMANELLAYTLADRGTFIAMEDNLELAISIQGDENLFNPYGIIAVNPEKHQGINYQGAMALIEFITSLEGKSIINSFTLKDQQLFLTEK